MRLSKDLDDLFLALLTLSHWTCPRFDTSTYHWSHFSNPLHNCQRNDWLKTLAYECRIYLGHPEKNEVEVEEDHNDHDRNLLGDAFIRDINRRPELHCI